MKDNKTIIFLLTNLVLLFVLVVGVSFRSFSQIETAAKAREHTSAVLASVDELLSALKDAETGQRGYLLTGDPAFLQPYLTVRDSVGAQLKTLRTLTLIPASLKNLDSIIPLTGAKLAEMARVIDLHNNGDVAAATAAVASGQGKRLMDSIRTEMRSFIQTENNAQALYDVERQAKMQRLFTTIIIASMLMLLLALASAFLIYRESQQRLKNLVHIETEHRLDLQEKSNKELQTVNAALLESDATTKKLLSELEISQIEVEVQNTELQRSQHELETQQLELEMQNDELRLEREAANKLEKVLRESEEHLAVTLNSIGDAVIVTDYEARVTRLNPIAAQLTGWTETEAIGRPVEGIFNIINKDSRQPAPIPVLDAIAHGTIQGLANHTVLIARGRSEYDIADSCAPIRNSDNQVVGAVLVFRDVTEEYAVQQSLRDNAALMRAILNTVVDGIITIHASGGIIETVNPAAELMFGYSAVELDGQNFSLLIPELDEDQRNGSLEYYSASGEALTNGHGREVIGRRKDGSFFPLELAANEMRLGGQRYFTGILRDATTRKQIEAEQKQLSQRLRDHQFYTRSLFESNIDALMTTDPAGIITDVNKQMEALTDCTRDELIGAPFKNNFTDPERAEASIMLALREKKVTNYELTARARNGKETAVSFNTTTFYDRDRKLQGVFAAARDVTERKLLDQILQEKNIELESARSIAEKTNLAKSDFLSSMSHELRTPLSAILGFAQLMESGSPQPTPAQKRSIDQILKAGWYLLELINEILDLAVIESGKLSMSLEPVSLPEIMHECEALVEPQAKKQGISVTFVHFETPCFIQADRTRVKQVLINLLSNAIKYNNAGGTVVVDSVQNNTGVIRINVRDSGEGLIPEQLAQLFQPFNRLGQEASTEQGTGIGLVVSKRLVEWMGGVIGVESTVGSGSVFWIELNLTAEPTVSTLADGQTTAALHHVQDDEPLHIVLYVEDNPANLMLVKDIIARRPDIRLLSALDGKSGIELARASLPDVILMDIHLPGISGIDAMKILAADQTTAHIPVIALSANAIPRDIEKGLELGFFRYLTKPINVIEFIETLDIALRTCKKEQI